MNRSVGFGGGGVSSEVRSDFCLLRRPLPYGTATLRRLIEQIPDLTPMEQLPYEH